MPDTTDYKVWPVGGNYTQGPVWQKCLDELLPDLATWAVTAKITADLPEKFKR